MYTSPTGSCVNHVRDKDLLCPVLYCSETCPIQPPVVAPDMAALGEVVTLQSCGAV